MGLNIAEIVPRKSISFSELKGKIIAVDAFNTLYQFLSSIRQPDGTPLQDSKGRTTSHLSGLFYRNISLLSEGLKLVYVFDGETPEKKFKTHEARKQVKDEAQLKYEQAKQKEDVEEMGKYARQLSRLDDEKINESKELLKAMGIAVVQAPSEGESEAAFLSKKEQVYAVGSQDYDSLLFGAKRLVQNLTLARKRKTISGYVYISPEIIELEEVLNKLQINLDQLICLGILIGTDYNKKGVVGIGQKKALALVQKHKQPYLIFEAVEKIKGKLDFDWQEIFELFHKPKIKPVSLEFPKINENKIKEILVDKHDFNESRVDNQLEKLKKAREESKQRTLF